MRDLGELKTPCCGFIVILAQNKQEIGHFSSLVDKMKIMNQGSCFDPSAAWRRSEWRPLQASF
jgi:hypothetical protein